MFKRGVPLLASLAVFFAVPIFAQTITTVAGGGPNNIPALSAGLVVGPLAVDSSGNVYFADFAAANPVGPARVLRIDASGQLTIYAGTGADTSDLGDGGPATSAGVSCLSGLAADRAGNLFIADGCNNLIRRVDAATHVITTVAGSGNSLSSFSGDGGPATSATFSTLIDVAVDDAGNLFIADRFNYRVRRVDAVTHIITTVAGNGINAFSGDGGPATSAALDLPTFIAVDRKGDLFIGDLELGRIRRVDAATNVITTVAGPGHVGGDVEVDDAGNLFSRNGNQVLRVDATTGAVTTVAGNGMNGYSGDGGPATSAEIENGTYIAVDGAGDILIADAGRIRRIDAATQVITTIAGNGTFSFGGDGYPATSAELFNPYDVALDGSGNLYIADEQNRRIRRVDAGTHIITTVAGNCTMCLDSGDGGPATSAGIAPLGIAVDNAGNIFLAEPGFQRVRRVDAATGIITTVAGDGYFDPNNPSRCRGGFGGDGGPATSAELNAPDAVAVDREGNLFIADTCNYRIRKVDAATQVITTIAGNGINFYGGDGGPAASAVVSDAQGLSLDELGNLFIADTSNQRIRRIDAVTQVITTVAGNGTDAFAGDGGPATSASLQFPISIAVDSAGNLFIPDGQRIRRVDAATQIITTYAGRGGIEGFSGDGGPATSAQLNGPSGVAVDKSGNLLIADFYNNRIREVLAPKQSQTISFAPIPNRTFISGDTFAVSATASAGLPVTLTASAGSSCTILGSTVQITNVGGCTITADQSGNGSYNPAPEVSQSFRILYASAGQPCFGAPGHSILPPISAGGTSVFNQGRTVPAKFRVCDGNGHSVGTPGVVTSFSLIDTFSGVHSSVVSPPADLFLVQPASPANAQALSSAGSAGVTPDTQFLWDATDHQWIFNIRTSSLAAGKTYVYRISLHDGTSIVFQFGLN